ncbi:IDEAL domain-containing protein [Neobacillus novalis]|uniref:IDEAL domain-containing protein n=1 Tax=Neobacillus novalis TaxID=220687 RepID=A0AA95MMA5_9BACI|nr:IDEAL domain-containing protein [Neobacillus novalis]WHY86135.1 IDEAL domain-containing protein [Neobacillus novalis]
MKKLLCKYCGNAEFFVVNLHETVCKCGLRLTKLSDYRREGTKPAEYPSQKRQADLISKIILLKQEIDKCLDNREQEGFHKLSLELKDYEQELLNMEDTVPQDRFAKSMKENKDWSNGSDIIF